MGLKEFLVSTKAGLTELQTRPKIHIVIGNESCDLDSAVSAVTYAYFLHQTKSKPDTFILPVLNIATQHFRLRLEIIYLLSKHNIVEDDLVFVDEIDLWALTQTEVTALSVTLVDHHEFSKDEECLRNFVVEVLDHRPLSGVLSESWNAQIERVGSCCTLVARKMLASADFSLDSVLAELLLGAILMDTGNMSASDNVGTPADLDIISQLKSYLPPDAANSLYEEIRNAKSDLSSLTVLEMLYKDQKILRGPHITVAMSSLTAKIEDVFSRPEFADDCAEFCSACSADVLIIMTLWKDGAGVSNRRIAVFSLHRIYREQITDVLLSSLSPNLELEPMTSYSHMENVSAFYQNNVQVFRKGVIPLIREFLAGENSTPDENLNALDHLAQQYSDSQLGSDLLCEVADASEEEVRKHINLAKAFQSDQFRTSQDRYDLAAIGTDPVISASVSSDSEFSSSDKRKDGGLDDDDDTDDNGDENKEVESKDYGVYSGSKISDEFIVNNKSGAGDGDNVDALVDIKEVSLSGDSAFVDNLIDFGFDDKDDVAEVPPPGNRSSDFMDLAGGDDHGFMNNNLDAPISFEPLAVDLGSVSDLDVKFSDSRDDTMGDLFSVGSDNADVVSAAVDAKDENNFEDAFQDHSPFNLLGPDSGDSPMDISSMPTSNQTSGQGSKIPSYPETPPNSCMEPSNAIFNKETQLPSFNSSEMVKRIHEKKAALAGHGGKQNMGLFDDEGGLEGLLVGGENSSGGGGSLISPAVPQNSYMDISSGFDFQSAGSQLPKLMDSDIMERVNEKRSQFEWSVESLEGSTSGVDIGPISEEGAEKSPFDFDEAQHITVSGGVDPQVPYTPQNSYVEEHFDTFARTNLPSLNNAEIVAKIKAKQSVMFGSHGSSRVSRSSHGSDDSGGCHSPDVVDKSPRGTSLDSPQAPYTPQNSYRDNLGVFETRNHLPDLNEVAERLSTENPLKRQFGKRSTSNSGGGSRDEENVNLNIHQHSLRHYGRNSSSQSDSQNTMSDVESLMSVSTDVGTPSENIVASGLASQMRSEIAMLSRKDTNDSDVFPPNKAEDYVSSTKEVVQPKVSSIDLIFENATSNNMVGAVPNGIDIDVSDGVEEGGSVGTKELFSPFDSEKVQSMEDHALFKAAESIVAQSVAAAVEFSQREEAQTVAGRKESRLRWNDDVELDNDDDDDESDVDHSQKIFVDDGDEEEEDDEDNDGSDIEDDTVGDISESFPENDLDKTGNGKGSMDNIMSENIAEEMAVESFADFDSDFNSLSEQKQSYSGLDQTEEGCNTSQPDAPESHLPQEECTQATGSDVLDLSQQNNTSDVSPASQSITDMTLNELAFELANELIQSVLDDFPFSEDLAAIHAEARAKDVGQESPDEDKTDIQESATKKNQETPLQYSWIPDTTEEDIAVLNMSANNVALTSADFSTIDDETSSYVNDSTVDLTAKQSGINMESKMHSESSSDPNSLSSSERKRLKDTDSSLVILENEVMTSFPERKMSTEFSAVEEEEDIIQSFPGRKFSKSEDYPNRRFSRDDNSSRRSSRLDDSDLEVTIGPEDIETGYLPNMDPFQGNLDIFETSFSKITDADRKVVEGESFRKASGEGFASDEEEVDTSGDNEDESSQKVDDGYGDESNSVVGIEGSYVDDAREEDDGDARWHIPEVREELVSDEAENSSDLDSQSAGNPTEAERFADFSRELQVDENEDAETSSELDSQAAGYPTEAEMFADFSTEFQVEEAEDAETSSELDEQTAESELETQTEASSVLEAQTTKTLSELDEPIVEEDVGDARWRIPEVREELVSDEAEISSDLDSESAGNPTEAEMFADFSRELQVDENEDAETSSELDSQAAGNPTEAEVFADFSREFQVEEAEDAETSSELGEQTAESELETQTEASSVLEAQTTKTLSELDEPIVEEDVGDARWRIPEVREELVSDEAEISSDLDSESAGNPTEAEMFADFSRELQVDENEEAETSSELDSQAAGNPTEAEMFADFSREFQVEEAEDAETSSELDDQTAESELETQTEASSVLEAQTTKTLSELDKQIVEEDVGDAMWRIPEVREELVSDEAEISSDLDSQSAGNPTEAEIFADLSRELQVDEAEDAKTSSELDSQATGNPTEAEMFADFSRELQVEEAEDAETSSELDEQTAESELEIQTEASSVLEAQTTKTLSELDEHIVDTANILEIESSKAARGLEVHISEASLDDDDDDVAKEDVSIVEVIKVPKQKKKIRVSFSEDFDDEIGDFNITSSSRSSLKSPPPLPSSEDSESPSPSPSPENVNAAEEDEKDAVSPLSADSSRWAPYEETQLKEVYHTSAGRISIGMGEEEDSSSSMAFNSGVSPSVASFTDEIIMKARAQVGEMIESAKGAISEADHQLEVADASLHASSAAVLYSSDVSQPDLSPHTSQSAHDTAVMTEDESNNAFSIVSSDFATFDSTNSDLSAVNSNPLNEPSLMNSLADSHDLKLTEPSAVTPAPLTFSQQQPLPAVLAVSPFEDATFDSLTGMHMHVRNLSSASTGSFQGAVYSEEWQDDEIGEVGAQSGLESSPDDSMRKKIVPDSNFVEAAVADNDAEVEDNEDKKDDDGEESDAGDLEWERRRLLQGGDDTPVKIPTRPGIEPTLTEEETSPEGQRWRRVSVSGSDFNIDLQAVEPFKNVLSHGGYYDEGLSAIIVFYGCNLPSRNQEDYAYIMNHLFHYVIHTLEELVADDYVIIYFHGSTPRRQMPSLAWLKRCYQSIDRRLKKNLKGLFLVHPTLWLRTIVMMTKPFISTKFSSKLRFVRTLEELNALVPLTNVTIPDAIVQYTVDGWVEMIARMFFIN